MGKPSRDKGARYERKLVEKLRDCGVEARRVPLSGAAKGYPGDVVAELGPHQLVLESKARKGGGGFVQLERWLGSNDALVLWRERAEPMVCLTWESFARLCTLVRVASNVGGEEE